MKTKLTAIAAILALIAVWPPFTMAQAVDATYTWTEPTSGSLAVEYAVESSVNGGAFALIATVSENLYTITGIHGNVYVLRVAGIDEQDRQGPWSQESQPWTVDAGPPSQPGQPNCIDCD